MENRTEQSGSMTPTYRIGNATVRIHAGKMTKEERQAAFEQASRKMRREMEKQRKQAAS